MTLLRKYYDTGIEGGGIPDEVRRKIEEKFIDYEDRPLSEFIRDSERRAAKYGYSLASKELARLNEENERLRGENKRLRHYLNEY